MDPESYEAYAFEARSWAANHFSEMGMIPGGTASAFSINYVSPRYISIVFAMPLHGARFDCHITLAKGRCDAPSQAHMEVLLRRIQEFFAADILLSLSEPRVVNDRRLLLTVAVDSLSYRKLWAMKNFLRSKCNARDGVLRREFHVSFDTVDFPSTRWLDPDAFCIGPDGLIPPRPTRDPYPMRFA